MAGFASSFLMGSPAPLLAFISLLPSLACSVHLLAHALSSLRARGASVIAVLGALGALVLAVCGAAPAMAVALERQGLLRALAYVAGACSVWFSLSVLALNTHAARHRMDPRSPVDFIIVPGAALQRAEPSPILAARLDRALALWRAGGCRAHIVVSGGQGSDERVSEAAAMRTYLLACGVPARYIWQEARSTSTQENMRFSLALLERRGVAVQDAAIAVVSTDHHLARCMRLARRCGAHAAGVGASSAGRQWSRGYLREVAAFTKVLLPSYVMPAALGLVLCFVS